MYPKPCRVRSLDNTPPLPTRQMPYLVRELTVCAITLSLSLDDVLPEKSRHFVRLLDRGLELGVGRGQRRLFPETLADLVLGC